MLAQTLENLKHFVQTRYYRGRKAIHSGSHIYVVTFNADQPACITTQGSSCLIRKRGGNEVCCTTPRETPPFLDMRHRVSIASFFILVFPLQQGVGVVRPGKAPSGDFRRSCGRTIKDVLVQRIIANYLAIKFLFTKLRETSLPIFSSARDLPKANPALKLDHSSS